MNIQQENQNTQTLIPIARRTLSHEFYTALTGILGNAELLRQENLTPQQADCISDIRISGEHLLEFVRFLLKEAKQTPVKQANYRIK